MLIDYNTLLEREANSLSGPLSGRSPSRAGFARSTEYTTDTSAFVLQNKGIIKVGFAELFMPDEGKVIWDI